MNMKKLYTFLYVFLYTIVAFAQHRYSGGSNLLYWAIVGGISSALIYLLYIGFVYGISFIRRIFKNKQCDSELDCQDDNFEQDSVEQNIISDDNRKISEKSCFRLLLTYCSITNDDNNNNITYTPMAT